MWQPSAIYEGDLAFIHHTGFGTFAHDAAPGLLELLRQGGVTRGTVVDLACGSGIWAAHLLTAGYDAIGIDISPAMIELARSNVPGAAFLVGDVATVDLPASAAVTCIGEGLTYLPHRESDREPWHVFGRVHRSLAPGGLFIFDGVLMSPDTPMQYSATRHGDGWRVTVHVEEDLDRRILTRHIETVRRLGDEERTGTEVHHVRTLDPYRVSRELESAGFTVEVTRQYGSLALPPRRAAFVAVRKVLLTDRREAAGA